MKKGYTKFQVRRVSRSSVRVFGESYFDAKLHRYDGKNVKLKDTDRGFDITTEDGNTYICTIITMKH